MENPLQVRFTLDTEAFNKLKARDGLRVTLSGGSDRLAKSYAWLRKHQKNNDPDTEHG